jgi:hypothetical protein
MKENVNNRRIKNEEIIILSKSIPVSNDKESDNSNMPSQYARMKNVAKREEVIKDFKDHTYGLLINLLKKQWKFQVYMKQMQM